MIYKWFWVDPFAMVSGGLCIIKRGEAPRRETSAGKIRNHAFRSFTTAFFSIMAKYCFSNGIFLYYQDDNYRHSSIYTVNVGRYKKMGKQKPWKSRLHCKCFICSFYRRMSANQIHSQHSVILTV